MLPQYDETGRRTSAHVMGHTIGLVLVSLAPVVLGLSGVLYLGGALILGGFFLWRAARFSAEVSAGRARELFYASIVYLPVLLGLMVFDKCG